jgi:hypothetical protein
MADPRQLGNMGMGNLGTANAIFKRKFRWTFALSTPCGDIPETIVKVANRPSLTIEETEINYLHGKMWIPGKASWETMTVTYYDVVNAGAGGDVANLYSWLSTVYNFNDKDGNVTMSSKKGGAGATLVTPLTKGYAGAGVLTMYDGCGKEMERWTLDHVWPQSINFGDLDYSSSEELNIELTLRYSSAKYSNSCGTQPAECGCAAC